MPLNKTNLTKETLCHKIMELYLTGLTYQQIAVQLNISNTWVSIIIKDRATYLKNYKLTKIN